MSKREILEKVAFKTNIVSGAVRSGAKMTGALSKIAPKTTRSIMGFAKKNPRIFASGVGMLGGSALGAGVGALINPGEDEEGHKKSRLQNILRGAAIGGVGGGLLGLSRIGRGFGTGVGNAFKVNEVSKMRALKLQNLVSQAKVPNTPLEQKLQNPAPEVKVPNTPLEQKLQNPAPEVIPLPPSSLSEVKLLPPPPRKKILKTRIRKNPGIISRLKRKVRRFKKKMFLPNLNPEGGPVINVRAPEPGIIM